MNDHVGRADDREIPVGRDAEVRIAVERERIQRPVIGDFGPDLDLRRESVLPADAGFDVACLGAGTLSLEVVDEFGAIGDVVERPCSSDMPERFETTRYS